MRTLLRSLRHPRLSLAGWMLVAVLLALLPMLLFAWVTTWRLLQEHEQEARAGLQRRAAIGAAAVARELQSLAAELRVLELSTPALQQDWASLQHMADRVAAQDPRLAWIRVQPAPGGRPIAEARTAAPPATDLAHNVLEVAQLAVDVEVGSPVMPIVLPLRAPAAEGRVLRAALLPDTLDHVLGEQRWPDSWTGTVIDQAGHVLADTRDGQRVLGQPISPALLAAVVARQRDVFVSHTLQGDPVYTALEPVGATGWTVSVGQPVANFHAQARRAISGLALAGLLCAAAGAGAAWWLARALGQRVHGAPRQAGVVRELGELHAELQQARTDALTGLPLRSVFLAAAEVQLQLHRRPADRQLALLALDLDGFKALNDRLGHAAGDRALADVGLLLRALARSGDLPCRLGGDEFVLLMGLGVPQAAEAACEVAQRLLAAVQALPHGLGCSIGVALALPGETLGSLMARADAAMYAAKRAGRNRVELAAGLTS